MTPAPLSLRAFGHRVLVALLICVRDHRWRSAWPWCGRRTRRSRRFAPRKIDPSLLSAGSNYLIIGSDTRSFVKSASDAEHFGSAQSAEPANAPTR